MAHVRYDSCPEWDLIGRNRAIRFRPRATIMPETAHLTLPLASLAASGALGDPLGESYRKRCVVLVNLRVRLEASFDLVLSTKSGMVALGECKLFRPKKRPSLDALKAQAPLQIEKYYAAIRYLHPKRLEDLIKETYKRFKFPGIGKALDVLKVPCEKREEWWSNVHQNACSGRIDTFVAVRTEEQPTITIYLLRPTGRKTRRVMRGLQIEAFEWFGEPGVVPLVSVMQCRGGKASSGGLAQRRSS